MKKLRNKKTGEIGYLIVGRGSEEYKITNDEWDNCGNYNSLAELNEEWEDYEEVESWWSIMVDFNYEENRSEVSIVRLNKKLYNPTEAIEIGFYFETKEEAEKAVEKLKAWRRLKDKGFRFTDWSFVDGISFKTSDNFYDSNDLIPANLRDAMDLLFGGEG